MFKVNNKNTRTFLLPGVFIVNFEHISYLFLVPLLLTLNKQMLAGKGYSSRIAAVILSMKFLSSDIVSRLHNSSL